LEALDMSGIHEPRPRCAADPETCGRCYESPACSSFIDDCQEQNKPNGANHAPGIGD